MFHDGHKLHMCKRHFIKIRNQRIGNLPIPQQTFGIRGVTRAGPEVRCIYRKGFAERIILLSLAPPNLVRPMEPRGSEYTRSVWRLFVHQCKWICLFEMFAGIRMDMVFVYSS